MLSFYQIRGFFEIVSFHGFYSQKPKIWWVFFPLYTSSFTDSTNHIDQAYLVSWQKRGNSQNNHSLSPEWIHLASWTSPCFHSVIENMNVIENNCCHPKSSFWYWLNELPQHTLLLGKKRTQGDQLISSWDKLQMNCLPTWSWSPWAALHHTALRCSSRNFSWKCPQVMTFLSVSPSQGRVCPKVSTQQHMRWLGGML